MNYTGGKVRATLLTVKQNIYGVGLLCAVSSSLLGEIFTIRLCRCVRQWRYFYPEILEISNEGFEYKLR